MENNTSILEYLWTLLFHVKFEEVLFWKPWHQIKVLKLGYVVMGEKTKETIILCEQKRDCSRNSTKKSQLEIKNKQKGAFWEETSKQGKMARDWSRKENQIPRNRLELLLLVLDSENQVSVDLRLKETTKTHQNNYHSWKASTLRIKIMKTTTLNSIPAQDLKH